MQESFVSGTYTKLRRVHILSNPTKIIKEQINKQKNKIKSEKNVFLPMIRVWNQMDLDLSFCFATPSTLIEAN